MSTPLYRNFKNRGTTFYAFPSTSSDPTPKFSKFVLLNIPQRGIGEVLDFDKTLMQDNPSNEFGVFTNDTFTPTSYAEQMIESLRNYVANHDVIMRESKINQVKDFYNILEPKTPTEKIFWKWLRKFNAIDLEPAENKVDWDKNLPNFENPNADTVSNTDHFRKYLWKERETTSYVIEPGTLNHIATNILELESNFPLKFKVGDYVFLDGVDSPVDPEVAYPIVDVIETVDDTTVHIEVMGVTSTPGYTGATITLDYHRLVQYIGEINVQSNVSTATKDEIEVTAYIPHQAGRTPTIMWKITEDSNYFPGVELPILPQQIQPEIRGAENLNSPIRQNPGDYPGLFWGQFDTNGRTYRASNGDKIRYSGDYYGILRNNNVGLDEDDFVERLSEFNSDNIDGLTLDFDLNHYLKMDITDESVGFNFDEFNQLSIDGNPPENFEYNAILWYYESQTEEGEISNNLYGVTFLNNPADGTPDDQITPYEKLVQTDEHDGLSYVHVLNLSQSVDNDTSSLSFDPLTLNNTFGFDLYNNVMSNVGKLNESFINIINEFVRMNTELNEVKSLVYSQVDIDMIKNKLKNLEDLLRLYSTYQFVDSETVKIEQDFSGVYPTLSFDVRGVEYESVISTTTTNINDFIQAAQSDFDVEVPQTNKLFLKITNDDITNYGQLDILFSRDFNYKQSATIYIDAKDALFTNKLGIWINFDTGTVNGVVKREFIDNIYLPKDIDTFVSNTITYSKTKWMSTSVYQNVNLIAFTGTTSTPTARTVLYTNNADIFGDPVNTQTVYVADLFFMDSDGEVIDYSGMYEVSTTDYSPIYIRIPLDSFGLTPIGIPRIYYYKGMKIDIIRINESPTSSLEDRYLIQKTIL